MAAMSQICRTLIPKQLLPRSFVTKSLPAASFPLLRPRSLVTLAEYKRFASSAPRTSTVGLRCYSTRPTTSSLNDPSPNWNNRPPKETILLDGCDFEHWLIVLEKPEGDPTRDDIIDSYIKTAAAVIGSEEEARKKIYSVSTKHYFAFGVIVSEEASYKFKDMPKVRWVLPDSYLNVREKDYGGEPFIDGHAVPYDPKYHEEWVRNNMRANERSRRNDRPRNNDRTRNYERRRENMQTRDVQPPPEGNRGMQNAGPNMGGLPAAPHMQNGPHMGGVPPVANMQNNVPNYGGNPPVPNSSHPNYAGMPAQNVQSGPPNYPAQNMQNSPSSYGGVQSGPPNYPAQNMQSSPPNYGGVQSGPPNYPAQNMQNSPPNYGGVPSRDAGPSNMSGGSPMPNYGSMPNRNAGPNAGYSNNMNGGSMPNNAGPNSGHSNNTSMGGVPNRDSGLNTGYNAGYSSSVPNAGQTPNRDAGPNAGYNAGYSSSVPNAGQLPNRDAGPNAGYSSSVPNAGQSANRDYQYRDAPSNGGVPYQSREGPVPVPNRDYQNGYTPNNAYQVRD